MSNQVIIQNAVKRYGDFTALNGVSLDIQEGEFFTLLGPSGCGKTTLLRMIAGFNSIEGGDFYFGEKRINDVPAHKRDIGMVFQNYAIFPHYTVRKNVEFGLKNKKLPKDKIKTQSEKFMQLMQIDQYADRMPERLSGGQQQRVALARALCIEPDVLQGQSRSRDITNARQIAMYLIRSMTNLSLDDIGKQFDNRDHSTVLYSIQQIEKKMKKDAAFAEMVKEIKTNINSKR